MKKLWKRVTQVFMCKAECHCGQKCERYFHSAADFHSHGKNFSGRHMW